MSTPLTMTTSTPGRLVMTCSSSSVVYHIREPAIRVTRPVPVLGMICCGTVSVCRCPKISLQAYLCCLLSNLLLIIVLSIDLTRRCSVLVLASVDVDIYLVCLIIEMLLITCSYLRAETWRCHSRQGREWRKFKNIVRILLILDLWVRTACIYKALPTSTSQSCRREVLTLIPSHFREYTG